MDSPVLIVLMKGRPEEGVLAACKVIVNQVVIQLMILHVLAPGC
jgi:hypothetical protein